MTPLLTNATCQKGKCLHHILKYLPRDVIKSLMQMDGIATESEILVQVGNAQFASGMPLLGSTHSGPPGLHAPISVFL